MTQEELDMMMLASKEFVGMDIDESLLDDGERMKHRPLATKAEKEHIAKMMKGKVKTINSRFDTLRELMEYAVERGVLRQEDFDKRYNK